MRPRALYRLGAGTRAHEECRRWPRASRWRSAFGCSVCAILPRGEALSNAGNWRSTGRIAVVTDPDKTESGNRVPGLGCEVGQGRFGVAADS
jgi:hypothetical protein